MTIDWLAWMEVIIVTVVVFLSGFFLGVAMGSPEEPDEYDEDSYGI